MHVVAINVHFSVFAVTPAVTWSRPQGCISTKFLAGDSCLYLYGVFYSQTIVGGRCIVPTSLDLNGSHRSMDNVTQHNVETKSYRGEESYDLWGCTYLGFCTEYYSNMLNGYLEVCGWNHTHILHGIDLSKLIRSYKLRLVTNRGDVQALF